MRKYFIVLILGLFLGFCFARSAYGQENYFTPGLTMKALQESKENSEGEKVKGGHDFYFELSTEIVELTEDSEVQFAYLNLQSVKYEDVQIKLAFLPQFLNGNDYEQVTNIVKFMNSFIQVNIDSITDAIFYCILLNYEDTLIYTLDDLRVFLGKQLDLINEYYAKFDAAYKENNFGVCVEQVLKIQEIYWSLYTSIVSFSYETKANIITFTYTEKE